MTAIPQKGDPWIVAQLELVRAFNRDNVNPNLKRGRMFFDFDVGRIRIAETTSSREVVGT